MAVVVDPSLGAFEWDSEFGRWKGSLPLPSGRVIRFDIYAATDDHYKRPGTPEVFAAAYPVAAWLGAAEADARRLVSEAWLDTYNCQWNEGAPITAEEFARRIELIDASVRSDGQGFTLWFSNDEIERETGCVIDAEFGADRQLRNVHLNG